MLELLVRLRHNCSVELAEPSTMTGSLIELVVAVVAEHCNRTTF
jgi:hypothetical protein